MRYKNLPDTDLSPSVICLGTSHFGDTVNSEDSFQLMDRFLDRGGNFLDTALVYGDWVPGQRSLSEKTIGQWLKSRNNRSRIVLATKGAHPELDTMHIPRMSENDIFSDVEMSLHNLQTDYIDLYWLHRDDPQRPVEELMDVLNKLVNQGKIRYFGCSNWRSERIDAAQIYAKKKGIQGFVASQTKWSLATYPPKKDLSMVVMDETELIYHERTGLAAIPYNSQASGFFSGRYRRAMLEDPKAEYRKVRGLCSEENLRKLDCVEAIAEQLNLTMTQVSLGYLLSHPFPVFPISGCKNSAQIDDTCTAGEVHLDPGMLTELRGTK